MASRRSGPCIWPAGVKSAKRSSFASIQCGKVTLVASMEVPASAAPSRTEVVKGGGGRYSPVGSRSRTLPPAPAISSTNREVVQLFPPPVDPTTAQWRSSSASGGTPSRVSWANGCAPMVRSGLSSTSPIDLQAACTISGGARNTRAPSLTGLSRPARTSPERTCTLASNTTRPIGYGSSPSSWRLRGSTMARSRSGRRISSIRPSTTHPSASTHTKSPVSPPRRMRPSSRLMDAAAAKGRLTISDAGVTATTVPR